MNSFDIGPYHIQVDDGYLASLGGKHVFIITNTAIDGPRNRRLNFAVPGFLKPEMTEDAIKEIWELWGQGESQALWNRLVHDGGQDLERRRELGRKMGWRK